MELKCDYCGKVFSREKSRIKKHTYCSKECMDNAKKDRYKPGTKFGELTIIEMLEERRFSFRTLRCMCSCGKETIVTTGMWGKIKSCGCRRGVIHRMSSSIEYKSRRSMHKRCYEKSNPSYNSYGGRGITVEYKDFDEFYKDVGPRPSKEYSIDRIDVNGNYGPGNCRWVTMKEQANNKRDNLLCVIDGEEHTLQQRADKLGLDSWKLKKQILRGQINGVLHKRQ